MRRILPLLGAFACVAAVFAAPASAQDGATTNQTMDDCKLIPDDAARLACYDRVIKAGRGNVPGSPATGSVASSGGSGGGAAGGIGSNVAQRGTVSKPMTSEERREANEKAFGVPGYERAKAESPKEKEDRAIEEVKEVTAEIASVGVVGPNRLRVTTTSGQVWDQTEGDAVRAKVGEAFTVKRNFMGGMVCKVGRSPAYRCARADRPGQS
ncbi:MAG TPA: hypothetical protein VEH07_08845 [Alphaproteobacteria bacterium]|nr:hypothetical protein [Alphaproteobacteria bacterium]